MPIECRQPGAFIDDGLDLDVKGIAGCQRQRRTHRRVIDRALADELRIAAFVLHVETQDAGGQLIAESGVSAGRKTVDALRALRRFRRPQPVIAIFVAVLGRHAMDIEEAHLLGLQIGDRGAFGQRVEIVIAQSLAAAAFRSRLLQVLTTDRHTKIVRLTCSDHLAWRAGDQQRLRVVIGGAAGIGQRHPPLHIDFAVALVVESDVVGLPAESRGQIAQSRAPSARVRADDADRKGGPCAQVVRHLVENDAHRQPVIAKHLDALADFQDHAAVGGKNQCLLARFSPGCGIHPHDGHFLADGLFHEFRGGQQVEIEVLLKDADIRRRE